MMVQPSRTPVLLRRLAPRRPLLFCFELRTETRRLVWVFPVGVLETVLWCTLILAGLVLARRLGLNRRQVLGVLWTTPPSLAGFALEVETRKAMLRIVPWPDTPRAE
ncbi:hypothetical protein Marky_1679 [Marinithermus hydrothermalis DSM 14884]|uniref:Uncharacterized protein n=2 Tax=Marinithermus TaxID=186191 RepID=F2NMN0_MARHT|nr:hypothetical protein Marky_1679 [Marinithermus hydrothermalis DSM 14884]